MAEPLSRPVDDESVSGLESDLAEHLNLICGSKTFEGSVTLKSLLQYLFRRRHESVNEYSIAVEALNRKPDFDPQIDATVRVQISRLRRRLKDFYLSEGASTSVRFTIPLGSHQLISDGVSNAIATVNDRLIARFPEPLTAPLIEGNFGRQFTNSKLTVVLGLLVLALAVICTWQYWQLKSQSRLALSTASPELLPFWKTFYANGKPIQIVLPNPSFFHWTASKASDLMVRDTSVNSFMNIDDSAELSQLQKQFGRPNLVQAYAVSSDIVASLQLLHYLDLRNVYATTSISSDASSDQFEQENVILMGTTGTLTPFKTQIDRLYFKFAPHTRDRTVPNPHPLAPEPREFVGIQESQTRSIYPGIISLIPGNSKDSHIMILQGLETAALVSYLTSSAGCDELKQAQTRAGDAPFFEAVILSEVEGNTILNSHLAAFRAFKPGSLQN